MVNYVFDVDGTLTPPMGTMDPVFKEFFLSWSCHKDVYLLTGSDAEKTIKQVGLDFWSKFICYQCCGNDIFAFGKKVYGFEWPERHLKRIYEFLEKKLEKSHYYHRFGTNIEKRVGLINFSVVGRECPLEIRKDYHAWDNLRQERLKIVNHFEAMFPEFEASIGGEISIDIYPKGRSKGQVYDYLYNTQQPIYFFGDKTMEGGNDHSLAKRLSPPHKVFQVSGPEETMEIMKSL